VLAACVGPQTQLGTVSQEQIVLEQARQQQFALENALKQQLRLINVANPLLRAAVPLCGAKVRPVSGFSVGNAHLWKKDYYAAALAVGYTDTLVVMHVTSGLAGDQAGIRVGDRIIAVNGSPISIGSRAVADFTAKVPSAKNKSPAEYSVTYRRGEETSTVTVRTQLACSYSPQLLQEDGINAYADGQSIFLTSGILRFFPDDNDLAVVIGHELAHDAMHHIESQQKNSLIGALLGAVVDVAAATQGVNTHGDFSSQGAKLGSMVFSQDFEREADYVGLYVLALAGRPLQEAPKVWRQMAIAQPGSIKFATSHPTTAERYVRLETWRGEIGRKVALGQPLMPEMKRTNSALASATSPGVSSTRAAADNSSDQAVAERPASQASAASSERNAAVAAVPTSTTASPKTIRENESTARTRNAEAAPSRGESSSRGSRAIIGAPSSDSARLAATYVFAEAKAYIGQHLWTKAEATFREALRLDGSVAAYHAELASLLMIIGRYEEAEAEYSAALLLDVDNASYRRLLKQARSKR
jgi:predicted Zn-dependent protease